MSVTGKRVLVTGVGSHIAACGAFLADNARVGGNHLIGAWTAARARVAALAAPLGLPCVYAPPGRDHEILAHAVATRLGVPVAPWPVAEWGRVLREAAPIGASWLLRTIALGSDLVLLRLLLVGDAQIGWYNGASRLFALTTHTPHWFIEHGFVAGTPDDLPATKARMYNWQRKSMVLVKTL